MKWQGHKLEHLSLTEMKEVLASMRYQPNTEEVLQMEIELRKLLEVLWNEY